MKKPVPWLLRSFYLTECQWHVKIPLNPAPISSPIIRHSEMITSGSRSLLGWEGQVNKKIND